MSLEQYISEQSIRGDLARDLDGIIRDYEAGTISAEDKELMVKEVMDAYSASDLARDEVMWRWAVQAAKIAISL